MISYELYRLIHFGGLFLLFLALGAAAVLPRAPTGAERKLRRLALATHGVGALLALTGGFGMLARLGIVQAHAFPGWVVAKMALWTLAAFAPLAAGRLRAGPWAIWIALPLIGLGAAYLARFKPF
ncbi:MAG: hypothetical protein ACRELD_13795 [Longimicrobiales bacterium]